MTRQTSTKATDRDATAPAASATDEVAGRLRRAAASIAARHGSDLNVTVPAVEYVKGLGRVFDTAPIPLKRLLGSPLVRAGKWATGPNKERQISSGWGDPRSFSYDPRQPAMSTHPGLDFIAPFGEKVIACADGRVTFVGYQGRNGAVALERAQQNPDAKILDKDGNLAADFDQIGFGGIAVFVQHDGDFEGYRTEYYHLSKILIANGTRVSEGQVIAEVGNTGLRGILPHLHFQVRLATSGLACLCRPTGLVPNYWPGHADSTSITSSNGQLAPSTPPVGIAPSGTQVVTNMAAGQVQASDRATIAQNQGVGEIKQNQARHAAMVADRVSTYQGSLYAAVAAFQGAGVTVASPMTFDFEKGTWTDGRPV